MSRLHKPRIGRTPRSGSIAEGRVFGHGWAAVDRPGEVPSIARECQTACRAVPNQAAELP